MALTNGRQWQLYHLTFDDGIQNDIVMAVDLLTEDIKIASDKISLLHKKSILKNEHENYSAKIKALSPESILQSIFHENTLRMMRMHLKKMSGITIEEQDLILGIKSMISPETWESIGNIKVKRKRKVARQNTPEQPVPEPSAIEGETISPNSPCLVNIEGKPKNNSD